MLWLIFAFSGPVLWAASTHIDKYLVDKYFGASPVAVLLIFTALIGLLTLPVIAWLMPRATTVPPEDAALMALAGVLYMVGMLFYLQALRGEDASAVAPFFQASPLIGYVLGYLVLGERLSSMQMIGGILIIGGTALVSLQPGRKLSFKRSLVALMLGAALMLAVSSLIFKVFALRADFWSTTFWMYVGEGAFGALLPAIPSIRKELYRLLKASPGAVLSINAVNELINLAGSLGARYALILAPLSLVQAIGSTTTLFVFVIGLGLSWLFPRHAGEPLGRSDLLRKAGAAIIVAIGAYLVSR
ncbi:MAG TPA: DMT family transporter [Xanthobacteraceae bacterium]|nr:DMT family transporter [Xanthobacteraceae bacterium]